MNGNIMLTSQSRKRQYADGAALEQASPEKRQATEREIPQDMPSEFAHLYRQKEEMLNKMFEDSRKLLQMESNHLKARTCKYGYVCTGYDPDPEKAKTRPPTGDSMIFSMSCSRVQWWIQLQKRFQLNLKKELREIASKYFHVDEHGKHILSQPKPAEHPDYPQMQHQPAVSSLISDHVSTAHHVDPSNLPHMRRDDTIYGNMPMAALSRHSSQNTLGQGIGNTLGANHKQSSLGYSAQFALP